MVYIAALMMSTFPPPISLFQLKTETRKDSLNSNKGGVRSNVQQLQRRLTEIKVGLCVPKLSSSPPPPFFEVASSYLQRIKSNN
jgi:hypothetical protein